MRFKEFYLTETKEFNKPEIEDYVGKFGKDSKLQSFDKVLSNMKIFEITSKKIVYGTDAKRVSVDIEQGDDRQEQIDFENKILKKETKNYNDLLKHYYDNVYEKKFINEVDEFRKTLNSKMKGIVSSYIVLRELSKLEEMFYESSVSEILSYLKEDFDSYFERTEISRKEYPKYGYYIKTESVKHRDDVSPFEIKSAYTIDGDYYLGDERIAKFICEKKGLIKVQPRLGGPGKVCSIGFNEKENKWHGWSHRAICGFGIGDKVFEQNFGDDNTKFTEHGKVTIKNLEQAKQAASNFAGYVS